jgi:ABC-type transport system involved in cytochrome bd biosynthesis fused ATPase/permease subunit
MPAAAVTLLIPSAIALTFLFFVLARPMLPVYNRRRFVTRIIFCAAIVIVAVAVRPSVAKRGPSQIGSVGLRFNSQLRAVMSLILTEYRSSPDPMRKIPTAGLLKVSGVEGLSSSMRWETSASPFKPSF